MSWAQLSETNIDPVPDQIGDWHHLGRVVDAVWDQANRAKDRQDEALDPMRVGGGMTLDQFLESVTR